MDIFIEYRFPIYMYIYARYKIILNANLSFETIKWVLFTKKTKMEDIEEDSHTPKNKETSSMRNQIKTSTMSNKDLDI